ncbi:hypothetical protein HXX76_010004 [Chlamydomonas incerta]|uniref:PDEase domain-containing protein n=1 Tax=Chlamydomonas incerta TaxID=51695 RepID=A0A835VZ94_CHLIN|nr:hypothetical protein HXX76_010004 [Chlamydomonas incerta]|eukprot:KAG2430481.1 hypothetical protein HXX76_010004 [Chlamydomonas incerta]
MHLQLLPAGVLRVAYPPPQPSQSTADGLNGFGHDIFSVTDAAVRDSVRRSLEDPRVAIDGPLPGIPPAPELRVLVVRQAVYVDVTSPDETFGRPDSPNPVCGAPCQFQPYAAAQAGNSSGSSTAAGGGGGEGAAVVGRLWWGMVAAVVSLDAFTAGAREASPSRVTAAAGVADAGSAGAVLRALEDLGYRYSVANALGGLVAASAHPPSSARGGAEEAVLELPGTQWVLRVSPASADDGNWMPAWMGGAMAAVVVAAAVAAIMLFGLLVSRRRHAMLLEALLPPDMLHGLRSNAHVVEKMDPSHEPRITESPAELLMDLLAELLAGQSPDLRQVVLLRSLLLRNADWYRPLGMGGQLLHNANLEDDVARALMRQLGTGFLGEDDEDEDDDLDGMRQLSSSLPFFAVAAGGSVSRRGERSSKLPPRLPAAVHAGGQQWQQPYPRLGGGHGEGVGAEDEDAESCVEDWRGSQVQDLMMSTQALEVMEAEAAAAAQCRTLRGALSLILDNEEEAMTNVTGGIGAAGGGGASARGTAAGSCRSGGRSASIRGIAGGASAAAAAAAAAAGGGSGAAATASLITAANNSSALFGNSTGGQQAYDSQQQPQMDGQWGAAGSAGGGEGSTNSSERIPAVLSRMGWHLLRSGGGAHAHATTSSAGVPRMLNVSSGAMPLLEEAALSEAAVPPTAAQPAMARLLPRGAGLSVGTTAALAAAGSDAGASGPVDPPPSADDAASVSGAGGRSVSSIRLPPWLLLRTAPPDLLAAAAQQASNSGPVTGDLCAAGVGGGGGNTIVVGDSGTCDKALVEETAERSGGSTSDPPGADTAAGATSTPASQQAAAPMVATCPSSTASASTAAGTAAGAPGMGSSSSRLRGGSSSIRTQMGGAPAAAMAAAAAAGPGACATVSMGPMTANMTLRSPLQQPGLSDGASSSSGALRVASTATGLLGVRNSYYSAPGRKSLDIQQLRRNPQKQKQPAAAATVPSVATSSVISGGSAYTANAALSVQPASVPEGYTLPGDDEHVDRIIVIAGGATTASARAESASALGLSAAAGSAQPLPRLRTPVLLLDQVEALLARADELQYDMWALADATAGRPLSVLAFFLFQRQGLIRHFGIKPIKLIRLLRAIECGYPNNPYHNATHAADVVRTTHVLAHAACLTAHHLDTVGLLALYFAAIIHDFGHPGLTGDFLVATSHPLALRYNDRSPLENHHASAAFTLMAERPELDAFEVLSREQRTAFRKQVVELVMGTDMKQHFALLSQFTNAVSAQRLKQQHQQQPVLPDPAAGGGGSGVTARGRRREPTATSPTGAVAITIGSSSGAAAAEPDTHRATSTRRDGGGATSTSAGQVPEVVLSGPCAQHHQHHSPAAPKRKPTAAADIYSAPSNIVYGARAAAAAGQQQQPAAVAVETLTRQSMPPAMEAAHTPAGAVVTPAVAAPAPPADEAQRLLALQICLKVADIGHLAGTLPVHKRWLGVLEEEFFRQGDREKAEGLPISPLFDRAKQGVSKSQTGFYEFVALPLVRALTSAFPGAEPLVRCYEANYEYWKAEQQRIQP